MSMDFPEARSFDALSAPANAVPTELTLALARLRPGAFIAFTQLYAFDPLAFAHHRQATVTPLAGAPLLIDWGRNEAGDDVWPNGRFGWFTVEWQGQRLEVVCATWATGGDCAQTNWWLIADTEARARAFFFAVCNYLDDVHGQVLVFNDGSFSKSTELHEAIREARWDDLVLPGTLGDDVRNDARRFFSRRDFYEAHRLPWKRGVLLIGPPGNGKTHTVRALLNELDRPVIVVRSFVGRNSTSAGGIEQVFSRARRLAPAIIVLEDLDCLVDDSSRSLLLNELDGVARNTGLFVIATTNHPEKLDRSLLDRPSRFDRKFHFPLPDAPVRRAYLNKLSGRESEALRLSAEAIEALVERTEGFTFAYLKELLLSAALIWADEGGLRPYATVAVEAAKTLRADLKSVEVTLGTRVVPPAIGFAEAKAR